MILILVSFLNLKFDHDFLLQNKSFRFLFMLLIHWIGAGGASIKLFKQLLEKKISKLCQTFSKMNNVVLETDSQASL